MDINLSVRDVASLMNVSSRTVERYISQHKLTAFIQKNQKGYLIPLSSLDPKLQIKYYKAQNIQLALSEPYNALAAPAKKITELTDKDREKVSVWCQIIEDWLKFRKDAAGELLEADKRFIEIYREKHPELKFSRNALYVRKRALEAKNYEKLTDMRGRKKLGKSKLLDEIFLVIWQYWASQEKPAITACIEAAKLNFAQTKPELLTLFPSYDTIVRAINKMPKPLKVLEREGEKAYKDNCLPYINRDYSGLKSNDIWVIDNHTFDVHVKDNETGSILRLSLCLLIDACSWMPVGWFLDDNPSSDGTIMAIRDAINKHGIPKVIYMDNGSEFLTYDLAGRGHRTRKTSNERLIKEPIFKRLGIEMVNAIVKNAKAKPIERAFKDIKEQISKLFDGYCGGTSSERPEKHKMLVKSGQLTTVDDFREKISLLLEGQFAYTPYGGKIRADRGLTKLEVYKKHLPKFIKHATEDELELMLMRTERAQAIGRNGVHIIRGDMRLEYGQEDLHLYQGQKVYVRYNPLDMSFARVYDFETGCFIMTVPMNTRTQLQYLDNPQLVSVAMKTVRGVHKNLKKVAKSLKESVPKDQRISRLELACMEAEKNRANKPVNTVLGSGKIISFQLSGDSPENSTPAEYKNHIDIVGIDMNKILSNLSRRSENE